MSLNSYVLNGGVVNGSRSTSTFVQAVTASSTSTSSVVKKPLLTFIVLGNKYVNVGGIDSSQVNLLAINADNSVYVTTTGSTSNSTVYVNSLFKTALIAATTSTSSLTKGFLNRFVFTVSVVSNSSIVRSTLKTVSATATSAVSYVKAISKTLITFGTKYTNIGAIGNVIVNGLTLNADNPLYSSVAGVVSTATTVPATTYRRTVSILQTIAATLSTIKLKNVALSVSVASTTTIFKAVTSALTVVSTSVQSLIKRVQLTIVGWGSKYVITGGVGSSAVDTFAINADSPVYTTAPYVTGTAITAPKTIYKLLVALATTITATVSFVKTRVLTLSVLSTSTAALYRGFFKTLSFVTSSVFSAIKQVRKTLVSSGTYYNNTGVLGGGIVNGLTLNGSASVSQQVSYVASTATISPKSVFKLLIALATTITATLSTVVNIGPHLFSQTVSVVVTSTVSLYKKVFTTLSYVATNVSSLLKGFFRSITLSSVTSSTVNNVRKVLKNVTALGTVTATNPLKKIYKLVTTAAQTVAASIQTAASLFKTLVATPVATVVTLTGIKVKIVVLAAISYTTTVLTYVINYYVVPFTANARDTLIVPAYRKVVHVTSGVLSILVRPSKTVVTHTEKDDLDG